MLKNQLITPEGTKDYLFAEAAAQQKVKKNLRELFESRGFSEVITPGLEFLDVFSVKGHSIPVDYMYKLTDHKGRLMVLRPDSTMPIARLCATRLKGSGLPLRLYYNQPVYSANRTLRGRSDESMQAGVELIGSCSMKADLEIISTAVQALTECGRDSCLLENFRLEIGHIGIFNALADQLQLDENAREELRLMIESKNYPALGDMLDAYSDREAAAVLKQLPRLFGGAEVFEKAASLLGGNESAAGTLAYLQTIYRNLQKLGMKDSIAVDLGIVNRTDYYTGVVFKGYIEGHGEEVLSGGRYDSLMSQFGEDAGAIGFAVNVDAVARALLNQRGIEISPVEVLVYGEAGFEMEALAHLNSLTQQGIRAEFALFDTKEEALNNARKNGISRLDVLSSAGVQSVAAETGGTV